MIIKIKSENKYLLDILNKNPNTDYGLYLKELKNGVAVGNAVNENIYEILFQDTKYSYLPEEANQIDFQSHCSPLCGLSLNTIFFSHLLKDKKDILTTNISWLNKTYGDIDTLPCSIEISNIFIDSNWIRNGEFLLSRYFKEIRVNKIIGNNYSIIIEDKNIIEAINKTSLVFLFVSIVNNYGDYLYIDDEFAEKYVRILTNLDNVPYFVFYLFIKRCVKSEKMFLKHKNKFESYFNNEISFIFNDTHGARKDWIINNLDFKHPIFDYGCGELQYFKKIRRKDFKLDYFAHDLEDLSSLIEKIRVEDKSYNLHWVYDKNLVLNNNFYGDIILTEVIEHNEFLEAKKILSEIKNNCSNFNSLIITTPDSDFNQYYQMNDEFRHDDHKFEINFIEFKEMISSIFNDDKYILEFNGIGDCIKGIYPTSVVKIKIKK